MNRRISISPITAVWILIALFVGAAVQFALITPIFEAPDEPHHFTFAHQISNRWRLVNQRANEAAPARQEASQPPLFYAIAAVLIRPFDRVDLPELRTRNPHATIGIPSASNNRNYVIQHEPYPPRFDPPRAAVYATRALNILFGAVAVWAVWKTARAALPDRADVAVLACGLAALNPQFAFIGGAVNNDILSAMWGSLILWQTVVVLREGFSRRRSLVLALLVALAALTKVSCLLFGGIVAAATVWRHWRRRDWCGFLTLATSGLVVFALVAGWWYLRNLTLYGDFTGTSTMFRWVGRRPPVEFVPFLRELGSLTISYWAIFGWFNVLAGPLIYTLIDLILLAALAGILLALWRLRRDADALAPWALFALTFGLGLGALISWTLTTYGTQGRLLFPFIAAISALLALGLRTLCVPVWAILIPLGILAYAAPLTVIAPAYTPTEPVEALPLTARDISVSWDGQVALAGYIAPEGQYRQGDWIPVTLYWQPLQTSDRDYSIFIHLLGPNDQIAGQIDTYPAGGLRRTSKWQSGTIYPDQYQVYVTNPVPPGTPLQIAVGWYDSATGQRLQAVDSAGQPVDRVLLPAGETSP